MASSAFSCFRVILCHLLKKAKSRFRAHPPHVMRGVLLFMTTNGTLKKNTRSMKNKEKELSSLIAESFYSAKRKKQTTFWITLIVSFLAGFSCIGSRAESSDDPSAIFWFFLICIGFIIMTCIFSFFTSDDVYVEKHVTYTRSVARELHNKGIVSLCDDILSDLKKARASSPVHSGKHIKLNMDRSISDFAYKNSSNHT